MSKTDKSIVWFRRDLRIQDNPALFEACKNGDVLPIYILDDESAGMWAMGGASRVWLYHALNDLNKSLGGNLHVYKGKAVNILDEIIVKHDISSVYWNRCYEPWRIGRDKAIKTSLQNKGIDVESFNGSLLWEPWDVKKQDGTPYKVFTPFYRKGCLNAATPRTPIGIPDEINLVKAQSPNSIDDLGLLPQSLDWHETMMEKWDATESGARHCLDHFIENGVKGYKENRDFPVKDSTSKLSPYLHFGQISPHTIWYNVRDVGLANANEKDADHFLSEIGWREFSYHLLYHSPDLPHKNIQSKFDAFPWRQDDDALKRWQTGQTGYPIIDAGMRELWQTGYMHNRVRMIVGSFLVKNLLLDWRLGEKWFWDCLVDADLANNSASWQWIAGCGADAAPYFRIFNPVTQGQKFDPDGDYVRRYIPELSDVPNKYIHSPWEAPPSMFNRSATGYPAPIVDLKMSRERALDAFKSL